MMNRMNMMSMVRAKGCCKSWGIAARMELVGRLDDWGLEEVWFDL